MAAHRDLWADAEYRLLFEPDEPAPAAPAALSSVTAGAGA
jgi:hypothetical protein